MMVNTTNSNTLICRLSRCTAHFGCILRVEMEVLRFYANRVYENRKGVDPDQWQIVAAYRAFRRELDKKPGKKSTVKPSGRRGG